MASILVVDHDADVLAHVGRVLAAAGHQVRTATSAHTALASAAVEPFELMIFEMFLPGQDGVEIILDMRRRCPDFPMIAISDGGANFTAGYVLSLASAVGADATLAKPLSGPVLLETVDRVLAAAATRSVKQAAR